MSSKKNCSSSPRPPLPVWVKKIVDPSIRSAIRSKYIFADQKHNPSVWNRNPKVSMKHMKFFTPPSIKLKYTVVAERVRYFAFSYSLTPAMDWYFVLFNNSFKFWSIIITRDSFGILRTSRFQNSPWFW